MELGCPLRKIWQFPRGIDLGRFHPSVDGRRIRYKLGWEMNKIAVSTGRHYPVYGLVYLIDAIPRVVKEVPEARLLILGDGGLTGELKDELTYFAGLILNEDIHR